MLAEQIRKMGGVPEFFEVKEDVIQKGIKEHGEGNPGHNYTDRPNLLGTFRGSGGGRSIILNGHVDTMPYGNRDLWNFDPFSGAEVDGRILGLGSTDMKLMAALGLIYKVVCLISDVYSCIDEEGGVMARLLLFRYRPMPRSM